MDDLTTEARLRAALYHFLAAVYLAVPTPQLVEELKKLGVDGGDDLPTIIREYNDLFVVPLGRYTTPYEAVYRDEREIEGEKVRGLLMGPSTIDVVRQYKAAGADMTGTIKELPDHIGVELAFMEYLCLQEVAARESADEATAGLFLKKQMVFLEDHLTRWVSLLTQKICENARIGFYKELGALTEQSVMEHLHLGRSHLL